MGKKHIDQVYLNDVIYKHEELLKRDFKNLSLSPSERKRLLLELDDGIRVDFNKPTKQKNHFIAYQVELQKRKKFYLSIKRLEGTKEEFQKETIKYSYTLKQNLKIEKDHVFKCTG